MAGYRPDRGLARNLGRSQQLRDVVETLGDTAVVEARRIARAYAFDKGSYHDSIHLEVELAAGVWVARVVADDFKSGWIEFGVANRPPTATLRRAAQSLNLRFVRSTR